MKEFRRLMVWEKAHALTLAIYRVTADFPKEETYGIRSQMRRCSSSIPANIAEGCGRTGDGDFHRFLNIALHDRNMLVGCGVKHDFRAVF